MTIQDYVDFALNPENLGKFVIQEVDTNIVETIDGEEVRIKKLVKISLRDQGKLEILAIEPEELEKKKEEIVRKQAEVEELEKAIQEIPKEEKVDKIVEVIPEEEVIS